MTGKGRVDILATVAARHFVEKHVETRLGGFPLWGCGLGAAVQSSIKSIGMNKPVDIPEPLIEWFLSKLR